MSRERPTPATVTPIFPGAMELVPIPKRRAGTRQFPHGVADFMARLTANLRVDADRMLRQEYEAREEAREQETRERRERQWAREVDVRVDEILSARKPFARRPKTSAVIDHGSFGRLSEAEVQKLGRQLRDQLLAPPGGAA